ncbi:MAG: uroporphyrinogen decarboxylase family protein [Anaerolineae bacterium]
MNSKERMLAAIESRQPDIVPVAPHWWGNFKYEIAGREHMLDRWTDGPSMVPVYRTFYERFRPDWFHLSGGYPHTRNGLPSRDFRGVREGARMFLVAPDGSRDEILADESLASGRHRSHTLPDISSADAIDELFERRPPATAEQITAAGYTDHAAAIVREYGDSAFIVVNVGAPGVLTYGSEHYQKSLMALYDHPEGVKRLAWRRYEAALEHARAFAAVGVHAWLISEDMAGADTLSPRMYEEFLYPVDCWFFEQVSKLGMIPMVYFCGDVRPLIPLIRESGVKGLLVEESRKGFTLDAITLVRELQGQVCLWGNLDTTDLLYRGQPVDIERAVRDQLQAAKEGPFVVANGSPLVPGTPPQNVTAMIQAARAFGAYPLA